MLTDSPSPILSEQLRAGERLLWYGRPNPLRMARFQISQALIGVVWTGIVFVMFNFVQKNFGSTRSSFGSSGSSGFQNIFLLMLLLFIGVGLWMISTPLRNYVKALNTYYGITDQRAIIVSKWFSTSIVSYTQRDIRTIRRTAFGDGTGDIIFGYDQRTYRYRDTNSAGVTIGSSRRTVTIPIGFFGIRDHQEVESLMLKTFVEEAKS